MPGPGRATNEPTNYIAIGKQSAKDTEATTFYFLKHLDGSGFDVDYDVQYERTGGDGQEVGFTYRSMVKADGQLVSYAWPEFTARMLAGVLGSDTVASQAAGQDHTLSPVASLPYYTVEQKWADEQERNTNVKITQVDIEFEAGRPFKVTANILGGGTVYRPLATTFTPTREAGEPIFYPGASVVLNGGASGLELTKGKLSIQRGVDDGIQTTGLNRADLVETNQTYTLDCTAKYVDAAAYRRAQYNGGTTVISDLATAGIDLFAAQGSQSMRLVQPLLEVTAAKVNRLDPDGKTLFIDLALQSVKGATVPMFGVVRCGTNATAAFA